MTRTDEFCCRWLDGETLSPGELEELARASDDPAAGDALIRLMEIEASLRAAQTHADLSAAVMRQVRQRAMQRRVEEGVMARIRRRAAPRHNRVALFTRMAGIAAAVSVIIAIGATVYIAKHPGLLIVHGDPEVVLERAGQSLRFSDYFRLHRGDAVRVPRGTAAVMRFDDDTTLQLEGPGRLTVEHIGDAKRITLHAGSLFASVRKQAPDGYLLVDAEMARVRVIGTAFDVIRKPDAVHVHVLGGDVELSAGSAVLALSADESASVRDGRILAHGLTGPATWRELQGDPIAIMDAHSIADGRVILNRGETRDGAVPPDGAVAFRPAPFSPDEPAPLHGPEASDYEPAPWFGVGFGDPDEVVFVPDWEDAVSVTFRCFQPGMLQLKLDLLDPGQPMSRLYRSIRIKPDELGRWKTVSFPIQDFLTRSEPYYVHQDYTELTDAQLLPCNGILLHAPAKMEMEVARVMITKRRY